jgi:hypothetical protein
VTGFVTKPTLYPWGAFLNFSYISLTFLSRRLPALEALDDFLVHTIRVTINLDAIRFHLMMQAPCIPGEHAR